MKYINLPSTFSLSLTGSEEEGGIISCETNEVGTTGQGTFFNPD